MNIVSFEYSIHSSVEERVATPHQSHRLVPEGRHCSPLRRWNPRMIKRLPLCLQSLHSSAAPSDSQHRGRPTPPRRTSPGQTQRLEAGALPQSWRSSLAWQPLATASGQLSRTLNRRPLIAWSESRTARSESSATRPAPAGVTAWKSSGADLRAYKGQNNYCRYTTNSEQRQGDQTARGRDRPPSHARVRLTTTPSRPPAAQIVIRTRRGDGHRTPQNDERPGQRSGSSAVEVLAAYSHSMQVLTCGFAAPWLSPALCALTRNA
jgi:hypothetical protein